MIFALVQDFAEVLAAMPREHPRYRILKLLDEAIRRDVHFIDRHPTTFFQCMWNSCWWYDCPEAAAYYKKTDCAPPEQGEKRLCRLLEIWRDGRERTTPGIVGLRSLRPPAVHLGTAQRSVLRGHNRAVLRAAFAAHGRQIVSASEDQTVQFWDATTCSKLHQLRASDSQIWSLAVSPDSRLLATCATDSTMRLWEAANGDPILSFIGHEKWVRSVAFSPDSRRLASASEDGTVRLWDVAQGHEILCLRGHENAVNSVVFFPDGRQIASSSDDGTVRLWSANEGVEICCLQSHRGWVYSVAVSPDGRQLISGSDDAALRLWDAASGSLIRCFPEQKGNSISVAYSPDGRQVVCGSDDNSLRTWDTSTGALLHRFRGHEFPVYSVGYSPDGQQIVSGSEDGTVRLWDVHGGRELCNLIGHDGEITRLAFSSDGQQFISGSQDKTVRLWDAATGTEIGCFRGHGGRVTNLAFSPNGRQFISGADDNTVRLWDTANSTEARCFRMHEEGVACLAFSPAGNQFATGARDTIRLWDADSGEEVRQLNGLLVDRTAVRSVAFCPDGRKLAIKSPFRGWFWDLTNGDCSEVDLKEVTASMTPQSPVPWSARDQSSETAIVLGQNGTPMAWFPSELRFMITHPNGKTWAGRTTNYIALFTLEGHLAEAEAIATAAAQAVAGADDWYYSVDHQSIVGPVSNAELKRLVKLGTVTKKSLVSRDRKEWHTAVYHLRVRWPEG